MYKSRTSVRSRMILGKKKTEIEFSGIINRPEFFIDFW